MPAKLHILAKGKFRRFQGNHANCAGVEFQVTECEHGGRRFFVRENFRYDTFTSNSGVRWGLQQGHSVRGVNVLELACEAGLFDELARIAMGEVIMATPAISNGLIVIRTQAHLFAVGRPAR